MMGGGLLIWLVIGVVLYMLFSKRGGTMGCCGGHGNHDHGPDRTHRSDDDIIDLKKEDYRVR